MNPVLIAVVAFFLGWGIGLLDKLFTQKIRKKPENTPPAPPKVVEVIKENNLPGESTVMKVTIDQGLKWHVELDGTRLENPAALTPEQRQRVVTTVVQIRPWIDGKVAAQTPAAASAPAPARPAANPVPAPQPTAQTPPPPIPVSTPSVAQPSTPSVAPVKADLGSSLRGLIKTDAKPAAAIKPPSIVTMIDNVLQTKIPGSKFAGMGVRLEEGSFGEVVVYVGTNRYPGIDAVPDPEVQALIRSAIADWEKH
jgi:hypothetical protein